MPTVVTPSWNPFSLAFVPLTPTTTTVVLQQAPNLRFSLLSLTATDSYIFLAWFSIAWSWSPPTERTRENQPPISLTLHRTYWVVQILNESTEDPKSFWTRLTEFLKNPELLRCRVNTCNSTPLVPKPPRFTEALDCLIAESQTSTTQRYKVEHADIPIHHSPPRAKLSPKPRAPRMSPHATPLVPKPPRFTAEFCLIPIPNLHQAS